MNTKISLIVLVALISVFIMSCKDKKCKERMLQ